MSDFERWITQYLTFHALANLLVSFLYFLVFLSVIRMMLPDRRGINRLSLSIASMLFLLVCIFAYNATIHTPWNNAYLEAFFLFLAYMPCILFMSSRKEIFVIGSESAMAAKARFDKLKDDFLTVASHELRTPMSVINGFAEILVREKLGPLNDEQKRRVRKILMQGQRLHRIIDELLDLSRIRSGKIEVKREVFDIIPVLKASLDDHQIVCEQQKIELLDEIPDVLPDVEGDLERITQVIVNLLNNAIKYTPAGGAVTLRCKPDDRKRFVIIEVCDTGIGISPAEQSRVFDEFYRANQEHTKKYSGSGLGLAIVRQLVESQGGSVGMRSDGIGKGSVFFFTIPIAPKQNPSKA